MKSPAGKGPFLITLGLRACQPRTMLAGMKVFGIGLHKTGTSSLHVAFLLLGLRSRHYFPGEIPLESFDCFSDMPIPLVYPELDRRCPGSKFILTTRDKEAWLASCRRWFAPTDFPEAPHVRERVRECYGTEVFDEAKFSAVYDQHHEGVRRYFARRAEDLLEFSLVERPAWEPLCEFLGLPVPDLPFPHANEYRGVPEGRAGLIRRVEAVFGRPYWDISITQYAEEMVYWRQHGLWDPALEPFQPERRLVRASVNPRG
jgi:hypothetical protein